CGRRLGSRSLARGRNRNVGPFGSKLCALWGRCVNLGGASSGVPLLAVRSASLQPPVAADPQATLSAPDSSRCAPCCLSSSHWPGRNRRSACQVPLSPRSLWFVVGTHSSGTSAPLPSTWLRVAASRFQLSIALCSAPLFPSPFIVTKYLYRSGSL